VAAHQDKADAEQKAHQDQFKDIEGHMEGLLEGLRSCGRRMTACQVLSVACPEKSKTGSEEMEAEVVTFKECSDKMEATDLEANTDATEAVVEQQKLLKKEINFNNIRSLED
jgi:hypothetical protein